MIPLAPNDFWQRVIERMAALIFERETRVGGAGTAPAETRVVPLTAPPRSSTGEREGGS